MSSDVAVKASNGIVGQDNVITTEDSIKDDENEWCRKEFIYGGPFIKVEKPQPFLNTATPMNLELQGTFKKSFAYYSLKERMPVILTKIIDYLSREAATVKTANNATDEDIYGYIHYISKLKNELVTNKEYELFQGDSPDVKRWNEWIEGLDQKHYFTNTWVFSECYIYRRLREGCELTNGLNNYDPFSHQKDRSFENSLQLMCSVADRLATMLPVSEKDKRKADFITLLKICLWANKCDLSLSMGEQVSLKTKDNTNEGDNKPDTVTSATSGGDVIDPFQMIIDFKDKILVDDTSKIADQVVAKAESIAKAIEGVVQPPTAPEAAIGSNVALVSPPPPADSTTAPAVEGEEAPKAPIPCPAKVTIPQAVIFDIVCDNAGYELFSDLCLAHFLVAQKIVQKVRFHVKKMPWFVSDVTPRDFMYVINACYNANYQKEIPTEPKPAPAEGEVPEPEPPRVINADGLRQLGEQWSKFVDDGTFIVMSDDYWTWPHIYKDMKKYDYNLYRKLQYAVAILFKGDLNYRKLVGERNWNPVTGFEPALQGFMPAPLIAVRTVKADLICGLPKGKWEQLNKIDEKWMEKGDYGVIQFCAKAEALKVAEKPCLDYGDTCRGVVCPAHIDK